MGDRNKPQEARPTEYKAFPFEVTSLDFEGRTLEGYASIFGNLDSGGDIVHKGAFGKTLKERGGKVKFLWQHDSREPLGRPLELREDDKGLFIKAIVSKTRRGLDTLELLRDGAINEFSIGYDAIKGGTDYSEGVDGSRIRNLREIKLYEFSLVTFAMNEEAQVTALKEEIQEGDAPAEGKPAPDVTENTIRIRVRDPGDFEEDSFRTIRMGSEEQGIQAVIGRLEGETSTTVQSYVFDKEKWTVEEAQGWVDEHKKSASTDLAYALYAEAIEKSVDELTDEDKQKALEKQMTEGDDGETVPTETDEGPYLCECLECGHEAEFEAHCRDVKCPECGGKMRRKDRPGVGKDDDKGAIGKADWPLAGRDKAWDNSAAEKRIRSWAGAEDGPNAKYRSCHFWYDAENADNFTAYKLLFCDVVNGNVQAIPRGLFAVAAVLQGARGGAAIPAADQATIKGKVGRYYARMREEFDDDSIAPPWEKSEPMRVQSKDNLATCPTCGEIIEINIPTPDARAMLSEAMDKMKEMLDEEKAGRVLAARNATRIANALTALIEVLEDAGVNIPGYGEESPDDEEAGSEEPPEKSADGPDESPTSVDMDEAERLCNQARILELDMELMQMTTEV